VRGIARLMIRPNPSMTRQMTFFTYKKNEGQILFFREEIDHILPRGIAKKCHSWATNKVTIGGYESQPLTTWVQRKC